MPDTSKNITSTQLKAISATASFEESADEVGAGVISIKFPAITKTQEFEPKLELLKYAFHEELKKAGLELDPNMDLSGNDPNKFTQLSIYVSNYTEEKLNKLKNGLASIDQDKLNVLNQAVVGIVKIDINKYENVDFSDGDLEILQGIQEAAKGLKPEDIDQPLELADIIGLLAAPGDLNESLNKMDKDEAKEISDEIDGVISSLNKKRLSKTR